jgi:cell division protein YceG involved in septum cleavage
MLMIYFVLTVLSIICYTKIYITKSKYYKDYNKKDEKLFELNPSSITSESSSELQAQNQQRLLKMLILMSIAYVACVLIPLLCGLVFKFILTRPNLPGLIFV